MISFQVIYVIQHEGWPSAGLTTFASIYYFNLVPLLVILFIFTRIFILGHALTSWLCRMKTWWLAERLDQLQI